ncbi:LOW QUALITY PROTEIN: nectin-1 [Pleurodeles waltl]|uniref:LOW QUALITY PROTEIN: nectin-1 n=1 Tax=Pleurodeles waltl TaxID=8319 RepID=UPI0037093904
MAAGLSTTCSGASSPASLPTKAIVFWLLAAIFPVVRPQVVLVNDTVSGFIGTNVVLHCSFTNPQPSVKITQVTWQKATNGSKTNVAIFNPTMGTSILPPYVDRVAFRNPSFRDGTIELSRLELDDEGVYICEFATFPSGNRESQLNLTVLAKPTNSMESGPSPIIATPGVARKIVVATCTSANGKPASTITWETTLKGEPEYEEIKNSNGTTTVVSRYRLVPSREAHRQTLTCVINYQLDRFTKTTTLNVHYEPEVSIEGFDGNWYLKRSDVKLTCKSDANPPATSFRWRMVNGTIPENVEIQNTTLFFKGPVTYSLAGTYECEVANAIGTRSWLVEVNVTDKPLPQGASGSLIGIVGGGIVALFLIVVAISTFVLHRRQQKSQTETDSDLIDLPPSHKPAPPPKKKPEMKSHLTAEDIQVVHLENMKQDEDMKKLPLQTPYYDLSAYDSPEYSEKQIFGNRDHKNLGADEYLSHRCAHDEDYLAQLHPDYTPSSYPSQHQYPCRAVDAPYCYPPPGSRAPYVCPKEQYV